MRVHTSDYKEEIKNFGREFDFRLTYGTQVLDGEKLYNISPVVNTDLLKTVMKELDFESDVLIPNGTIVDLQIGLKVNEEYEYLDYGKYIIYESTYNADTKRYVYTCYDSLLFAMKDYEELQNGTFPMTVKEFITNVCLDVNLIFVSNGFANEDKIIPIDRYKGLGYTYRDVLDECCQVIGGNIIANNNGALEVKYPTQTNDEINEEFLSDINVELKEKYGPINSIVLSRSAESDNVYREDEQSVLENGRHELKIVDNQIMNFNDREQYLDGILEKLNGLEYYINDFNSIGITYLEALDLYNMVIDGTTYPCILLNDEQKFTSGLQETIYTEMPEDSVTDYTKADKTDQKINQTYLIVDKQNQSIEAVVSQVSQQNSKIASLTLEVDEIKSEIGTVADITVTAEGAGLIEVEQINESEPIYLRVYPLVKDIDVLRANKHTIVGISRLISTTIVFENGDYKATYDIPCGLYRLGDIYDEFILDYDRQECYCIRRIALDENGDKYLLDTETIENYPYPKIPLTEGNYKIYFEFFDDAYMFVRLMTNNIYTNQFATKMELNSSITQTIDQIELDVSKTYSTKQEVSQEVAKIKVTTDAITSEVSKKANDAEIKSLISQTTNEINLELSEKLDSDKYTHAQIVAKINDSTSSVLISADKINLTGYLTIAGASNTYASKSSLSSGTTTINGGCITTGTIDASKVTVKNLNASNITSGTISSARLDTSTINATSGTIGGWKIGVDSINYDASTFKVTLAPGTNSVKDILVVYNKTENSYPFYLRGDGTVHIEKADIKATINSSTINGSSITGGSIHIDGTTSHGYITTALTYHPYVSALNVGFAGSSIGGISFRDGTTATNAGSQIFHINMTSGHDLNIGADSGYQIFLKSGDTSYVQIVKNGVGYPIQTTGGSFSSEILKENIELFTDDEYQEAYDLLKNIDIYNYNFKYNTKQENNHKSQYGFIIDRIEENENYDKFLYFYKNKARIKDKSLTWEFHEGDEGLIEFEEYDRDNLIKYLMTISKVLQNKIENLEGKMNERNVD